MATVEFIKNRIAGKEAEIERLQKKLLFHFRTLVNRIDD